MRKLLPAALLAVTGLMPAAEAKITGPERGQIKVLMHTFESEMRKLRPYLASEAAFSDPEARARIGQALTALEKQVSREKPKGLTNNPGFRITYEMLGHHVRQTKKAFDGGKYQYARMRLNATGNFCMSCHTQTPDKKDSFIGSFGVDPKLKEPTVVNAEYLFVTRRFDQALERMNDLIRKYPASDLKPDGIMGVYRKKLAIFARVQRDPKAAIANFQTDLRNKEIPLDVRRNVEAWIGYLETWKSEKQDPAALTADQLLEYVKKTIPEERLREIAPADPDVVAHLRLSGLLYERLLEGTEPKIAQEVLYYLAGIEKRISPLYWYSLSDSYLRECVVRFPKSPMTKKCYDAYESDLRSKSPGKADDELQSQLEALKSHL